MSDPHGATHSTAVAHDHSHDHGHEGHISDQTFIKVFVGLLIFTVVSFGANYFFARKNPAINFMIIGVVACVKATLVMYYFMHLKLDYRKVFVFLIPICILAPMIIMVLWPDMVLSWRLAPPDAAP